MSETVIPPLPEAMVEIARAVAERTRRPVEMVLIEWFDLVAPELPIEALPDDQVLALRDLRMRDDQAAELGELLAQAREGALPAAERPRLDALMGVYERGMVYKARALKVAVERGLQPRLDARP